MTSAPEPTRRLTPELLATLLIVLAYIVWLLSLPAWPSQDGPVHLYYMHVLRALLSHQPNVYAQYYTIKHLLPPYALYYYALLALSKFTSLLLADRLIICAYVVSFVFGFRYLARALGPSADTTTLLATLLILNWSLGMGFVNFCLSLSFVFWALGLWLRFADSRILPRIGFLLLVAAITLTHPVPLLLLLGFCAIDLLQRLPLSANNRKLAHASFTVDVATLALASLALVYVRLFATSHPLEQAQPIAGSFLANTVQHVSAIVRLHNLMLLFGRSVAALFYRAALWVTPLIALALAAVQRLRNRAARIWTPGDLWLAISLALFVIVPLLPSNISNAYFFTERLTILLWLAPLLAASGWTSARFPSTGSSVTSDEPAFPQRSLLFRALLLFAIAANLSLLWSANQILRPIARQMAAVERSPADHAGRLALVLEDARPPFAVRQGPSWNPFYWAPVDVIRRDNAVLDNAPWLDSAIIPLGATAALPGAALDTADSISPDHLSATLRDSPAERAQRLSPVGLILIAQPGLPPPAVLDPAVASTPGKQWSCRLAPAGWYQQCAPSALSP
jgi:hypothetical protein